MRAQVVKPSGMATGRLQRGRGRRRLHGIKIESSERVGIGTKENEYASAQREKK
jgi:hypothetical protein